MSIDFSDESIGRENQIMEGVQIVDPKNRYRPPKSKLYDSDMGPLNLALGNDLSIQRLPEIKKFRMNANNSGALLF